MTRPTDAFANAVSSGAEAIRAAANDPADQVRLLSAVASYSPPTVPGTSPISQHLALVVAATAALCRRFALTSLARACADYVPTSHDDAVSLRTAVAALFDAEVTVAGDAGSSACYLALRSLRTAVVADLTTRGSRLPNLVTVTRRAAEPALVLAHKLYQDATRTDELVAGAGTDVPHPAFMPTTFTALGS